MTVLEKIKAMNVDEMAKFLENTFVFDCTVCPRKPNCTMFTPAKCSKALKEWLESEVS